ncbi:hypothetical protein DL771_002734 [Monosporascus sp. 5C6A]|nr:hypothetical protein DL771_002734 [Monosporascus sp. 5C6A]
MRREILRARAGHVGAQEPIVVEPGASLIRDPCDPLHGGPVQSIVDLGIARAHQGGETRENAGRAISPNVSSGRLRTTMLPM